MTTEIKQSIVAIWGNAEVFNTDLKIETDENGVEKNIKGRIGLQYDDNCIVSFDVYEASANKSGKENFKFKNFKTIMEEYKRGDKVFLGVNKKFPQFPNATIDINVYESNGGIETRVKNKLSLINRMKDQEKSYEYKLEFKVTDFIVGAIEEEYNEVQMTGRGLLKGFIVDYNGVAKPIEFILTKEGYGYAKTNWKENNVVDISGLVINKAIAKKSANSGFGDVKGNVSYDYIREHLVDAGSLPKYDSFTTQEIAKFKSNYDLFVNNLLNPEGNQVQVQEKDENIQKFAENKEENTPLATEDDCPF